MLNKPVGLINKLRRKAQTEGITICDEAAEEIVKLCSTIQRMERSYVKLYRKIDHALTDFDRASDRL